jgi:hypothetical protein
MTIGEFFDSYGAYLEEDASGFFDFLFGAIALPSNGADGTTLRDSGLLVN